jgi:hypothetical protein
MRQHPIRHAEFLFLAPFLTGAFGFDLPAGVPPTWRLTATPRARDEPLRMRSRQRLRATEKSRLLGTAANGQHPQWTGETRYASSRLTRRGPMSLRSAC